jgi:TonB family protein
MMTMTRLLSFRLPYVLVTLFNFGSATSQDLPSTTSVETPVRADPKHPINLSEGYPEQSRKNGEEGLAVIRIEVDINGIVRATQLVVSSGFARLDDAALVAFTGARMIPATVDGEAVATWANMPIAWNLEGHHKYRAQKVDDMDLRVPIIVKSHRLKVGPHDYPAESRAGHKEAICTIRALVDQDGTAHEARIANSTGSASLDQACVQAILQSPFIPAHRDDGVALEAPAIINMSWRLAQ